MLPTEKLLAIDEDERLQNIVEVNRTSHSNTWQYLPLTNLSPKGQDIACRLNGLGSPFYFIKVVLRKHRLSNTFHKWYCSQFECEHLLEVFEIPRDHFKTSVGIGMSMWWALPFTSLDEYYMRQLGYDDTWINWMFRAHNPNTRTLIAMEVIKNAWKCGKKISGEYESNELFKRLFKEILPSNKCQWSNDTMTHTRDYGREGANQGEGTYEFTGVDAALQSKHYDRMIIDDIFGKEALKSEAVADDTWDWFKLLVGAFDSVKGKPDELPDVVINGNRWSFKDLNWKIRENNLGFKFHTHDAEGGCCPEHPVRGNPLFPEEWSMKKLARMKHWLGEYYYSCQFRNTPIPPGGSMFRLDWIKYFMFKNIAMSHYIPPTPREVFKQTQQVERQSLSSGPFSQAQIIYPRDYDYKSEVNHKYKAIQYPMDNGIIPKPIPTQYLTKALFVDPNHSGEKGRSQNCILAAGCTKDPFRVHILEGFAEICGREDTITKLYEIGERWRIRTVWLEGYAGQSWIKTLLDITNEYRRKDGKWYFYDTMLFRDNRAKGAKEDRIEDMEPFFRRGEVWLCQGDPFTKKFEQEYEEYPHSRTLDILDTLSHVLANIDINHMSNQDYENMVYNLQQNQKRSLNSRNSITGY